MPLSQPEPTPAPSTPGFTPGGSDYEPRHPENTVLYRTVAEHFESFLAGARNRGQPAPRFVEQELRVYLRCGIPAHGFLRLRCDDCRHERLVPFSCKRRGFCPSCGGRRVAGSPTPPPTSSTASCPTCPSASGC